MTPAQKKDRGARGSGKKGGKDDWEKKRKKVGVLYLLGNRSVPFGAKGSSLRPIPLDQIKEKKYTRMTKRKQPPFIGIAQSSEKRTLAEMRDKGHSAEGKEPGGKRKRVEV